MLAPEALVYLMRLFQIDELAETLPHWGKLLLRSCELEVIDVYHKDETVARVPTHGWPLVDALKNRTP